MNLCYTLNERFRYNTENQELIDLDGHSHTLRFKTSQVLTLLIKRAGETISAQEFLSTLWPDEYVVDNVVKISIYEIRQLLGDKTKSPTYIKTVPKQGYKLICKVSHVDLKELEKTNLAAPLTTPSHLPAAQKKKPSRLSTSFYIYLSSIVLLTFIGSIFAFNYLNNSDNNTNSKILKDYLLHYTNSDCSKNERKFTEKFINKTKTIKVISTDLFNHIYDTAEKLITSNCDTMAKPLFEYLLTIPFNNTIDQSKQIDIYYQLYYISASANHHHDALKYVEKILLIDKNSNILTSEKKFQFYLMASRASLKCLYPQCNRVSVLKKGKQYAADAITLAKSISGDNSANYATALYHYAFYINEFDQTKISYASDVYDIYLKNYGIQDDTTVNALIRKALTLWIARKYAAAKQSFNQLEVAIEENDYLKITNFSAFNFLGQYYTDQKNFKKAESYFNKALALAKNDNDYISKLWEMSLHRWRLALYSKNTLKINDFISEFNAKNLQIKKQASNNVFQYLWLTYIQGAIFLKQWQQIELSDELLARIKTFSLSSRNEGVMRLIEHEKWIIKILYKPEEFDENLFIVNWQFIKYLYNENKNLYHRKIDDEFLVERIALICDSRNFLFCEKMKHQVKKTNDMENK